SFLLLRRPPRTPLFPYTMLFRSHEHVVGMLTEPMGKGEQQRAGEHGSQRVHRPFDEDLAAIPLDIGHRCDHHLIGAVLECEPEQDRKSTRLNSSHVKISYAVFCL